ncbi:MAG TPA: GTP-binding protein, partial [Terracidiphilus sp.]|nr:GTP-binding protein [Terracidiphilus sp.]
MIVGGFLGAGKTSLILAAARELELRGLRCAVILNDQSDELVDTHHADAQGLLAREVTGGCFCCKFSRLIEVIEDLQATSPDVIFAEPVGSCTDISAT